VILRGGSEAIRSNLAIAGILREALAEGGLPEDAVSLVPGPTGPRSTPCLRRRSTSTSSSAWRRGADPERRGKVPHPVIKHYKGVCHVYVDDGAEIPLAVRVCVNAKAQRPGVCNAMETLLVHEGIASAFLPEAARALSPRASRSEAAPRRCASSGRGPRPSRGLGNGVPRPHPRRARRPVDGRGDGAHTNARILAHRGDHHRDHGRAMRFLREVDSSLVLVNASTRFNDGYQLGLGAEIGISTTKIHAFGPMGLSELTTTKFVAFGDGQVRQ